MKRRIDQLLVERGLAESRHRAQALVLAGQVLADERKIEKPGQQVDGAAVLRVLGLLPFASRAGAKLEGALRHFGIAVGGRVSADLGASTGGFTDCLLQNGALRVFAFDVGRGQMVWKLRSDPRVVVRDRFNVRNLGPGDLPGDVGFVCMDLSFISVTKILPVLGSALDSAGPPSEPGADAVRTVDVVVLVKPQFEAGRGEVGKGGIVRDPAVRVRALGAVKECAAAAGYGVVGDTVSPLPGAGGNLEFLLYLQWTKGL